ncbi:MAG: ribose-phosphate pyrophosphokinase [Elusimicrobia bacterium GWC2_65_9]|nr:MAG: ribose-phosphate pyrophosphokinase [Elusimicrobia bacterium GWA2_66_18]OGR77249.1 MAG: ribose-phosphate pyrophosphokinase [Elusimicrobia bacterium GWC2_65_9]
MEGLGTLRGLKVFSGNANRPLAEDICEYLGVPLGKTHVGRFADGEINVQIEENVRGADCYVIQPTCRPTNENLMELLIMIDALRRASAGRITAVIPYFGYARADRKTAPRVPISSKLVANLIVTSGAQRVITMDLHAAQIQGFFDIPVDHLYAAPILLDYVRKKALQDLVIVSPDVGGVERARAFAKRLNAQLVIIDKRRPRPNEASIYNIIGDVAGKSCLILDDMVDTGGTLCKVADKIRECGATKVYAACVHGVLSGAAHDLIAKSSLEEMILTDSIPVHALAGGKLTVLSISPLIGEAIARNHQGKSISALFI